MGVLSTEGTVSCDMTSSFPTRLELGGIAFAAGIMPSAPPWRTSKACAKGSLYSPSCREGVFPETGLPVYRFLRNWASAFGGSRKRARVTCGYLHEGMVTARARYC